MLETLFASLAAKVAAGTLAVAMASTGAVAVTGNLPDAAQTTVSEAVDNIGINIPLGETEALAQEDSIDVDADVDADDGEDAGEPNENADFGRSVSEEAKDGGVDGEQVSQDARDMADDRKAAGQSHSSEGSAQQSVAGDQVNDTPGAEYKPEGVGRP
ncbi:MAG: hypothetical protein KY393_05155 [Actinobacteria bacterium]|nr:hypothetical protein [Actinomycetota bacterium]